MSYELRLDLKKKDTTPISIKNPNVHSWNEWYFTPEAAEALAKALTEAIAMLGEREKRWNIE